MTILFVTTKARIETCMKTNITGSWRNVIRQWKGSLFCFKYWNSLILKNELPANFLPFSSDTKTAGVHSTTTSAWAWRGTSH